MTPRATGVAVAFATALISGVAVYVNSHGVSRFGDATVYTTAKNAVAGVVLLALVMPGLTRPRRPDAGRSALPRRRLHWLALLAVACVGGSVPFVLFFEGLARADATQAAFIHKTLVVWVALLAVPLLRERVGTPHVLAIGLLLAGQAWLAGDPGTVVVGSGETMIFVATLLWAVEVVLVKRLLATLEPRTLAAARMAVGTVLLVAWVAVSGGWAELAGLTAEQWGWALLTGLLLSGYVATWYAALARAQAVDVTAVLVFGAVVTAVLGAADGASLDGIGLGLVAAGTAVAAAAALHRPALRTAT
jgi:drug/metabolite transporter (DMT)-like permease